MENKFTDNEIIKALECCSEVDNCEECPLCENCNRKVFNYALTLINHQKAEIEVLKTNNHSLSITLSNRARVERAEAIKEFAERVKQEVFFDGGWEVMPFGTIDNLVKEMEGKNGLN